MPLAGSVAPGAGSGAASPRARAPGFSENGLMATDDADHVTIERVLARPALRTGRLQLS